jgi:hypothetical protein
MLVHVFHNGFLILVFYYKDELAARGWGVEETSHLPASWILLAALGCGLAIAVLGTVGTQGVTDSRTTVCGK